MKKGPYTILSTRSVYKNPWIEVREDKVVKPNGKEGIFGIVDYGTGISVVPLDKDEQIYLVKEYYYAIGRYGLQVPSGGVSEGEIHLEAAKRELLEETGLIAKEWVELGFIDPLTMILTSPAYLFLGLDSVKEKEAESDIEIVRIPFEDAYQMVLKNEVTHAPSVVAILKTKIYLDSLK